MPSWFTGWPTRFVVTDLYGVTTTWLDKLTLGASLSVGLNLPFTGTVSVRPNDPRVNDLFTDGYPKLAQSNRLVYIFFDENPPGGWVCRLAGVFMSPEDQADADVPTTHFAFWDPWQFLNGTPVFNAAGHPPGPNGYSFYGIPGGTIAATVLANAITSQPPLNANQGGNGYFVDAGPGYGGTTFWGGVIESTPPIDYTVQQGQTVGQVWTDLLSAGTNPSGGPGGVDIVLTAIYDPVNRPGYTHELSIYNLAGIDRPYTPMSWGTLNRTSITADRQHDATPGSFVNVAKGYAGQGGPGNTPVVNAPSVNDFLYYWTQQWFPNQPDAVAVQAIMHQMIVLNKQGKRTFTLNPDPLRARQPFVGYNIGDRIPVNAPKSLRVVSAGYQRVQTIPLEVNPDGVTRVNNLLTSPDYRDALPTPPPPPPPPPPETGCGDLPTLFNGDLSTGDFSQWNGFDITGCADGTITIDNTITPPGYGFSALVVVPPCLGDLSRAELEGFSIPYGSHCLVNFQFYIDSSTPFGADARFEIAQWHAFVDNCYTGGLRIQDDGSARFAFCGGRVTDPTGGCQFGGGPPAPSNPYSKAWVVGTPSLDTWHNVYMDVVYDGDPTVGRVNVFMDGVEVIPLTYMATMSTGPTGSTPRAFRMRQGIYRTDPFDGTSTVYVGAMLVCDGG